MSHLLLYHSDLRDSPNIVEGRLLLIDTKTCRIVEKYISTSGAAGWQEPDEVWVRGKGAIPEPQDAGLDFYTVATNPVSLPHVKGVEGDFFPIRPFAFTNKSGQKRSDTGIHWDANIKGSAGCIVIINKPAFDAFRNRMAGIRKDGISEIPLQVSYEK